MTKDNTITGKQIAAFTVYSAFERVLIVLSGMISLIIMGRLGGFELAGSSIANTVINIFQAPFLSLGTAVMIAISSNEKRKRESTCNALVAGLFVSLILILFLTLFSKNIVEILFSGTDERIKEITAYYLTGISALILSCIGVIIALNTPFFVEIFNRDVSTSKEALFVVRLMCITIPFTSVFQCIQGVPNAVNRAKTVTLSTILCIWCIRIPIAYLFVKNFDLGFMGLFIGFMADYLTRSVLYLFIAMKILNREKS